LKRSIKLVQSRESAETVALQALGWIAGHETLLPVFLGATGASEEDVRTGATDPAFLGALLDFLMMDDAWVIEFCDTVSMPYDRLMSARHMLPGGEQVNWT
jgi:hypothetical protein